MQEFGRPSQAAAIEPPLRPASDATSAGFRADGGDAGWCVLRAATVTGVGHRLAGAANEDHYAWSRSGDRIAFAVADGLGSVPGSGLAAHVASVAAVAAAVGAPGSPRESAVTGIESASAELRRAAEAPGATTLLVGVVEPGRPVGLARVGDSTAFVVRATAGSNDELWRETFDPPCDEEDLVVVATGALTAAGDLEAADVESLDIDLSEGDALVVVSDGVAGPWRDGPSTVAPAMVEGILARPSPLQLAGLVDFSRQGCHDDRTVLAVWLSDRHQPPEDA